MAEQPYSHLYASDIRVYSCMSHATYEGLLLIACVNAVNVHYLTQGPFHKTH